MTSKKTELLRLASDQNAESEKVKDTLAKIEDVYGFDILRSEERPTNIRLHSNPEALKLFREFLINLQNCFDEGSTHYLSQIPKSESGVP